MISETNQIYKDSKGREKKVNTKNINGKILKTIEQKLEDGSVKKVTDAKNNEIAIEFESLWNKYGLGHD